MLGLYQGEIPGYPVKGVAFAGLLLSYLLCRARCHRHNSVLGLIESIQSSPAGPRSVWEPGARHQTDRLA